MWREGAAVLVVEALIRQRIMDLVCSKIVIVAYSKEEKWKRKFKA
jgi:hypothetical protein